MVNSLPRPALKVIDNYWKLKAAENKYVRCPYFRNPRSGRDKWGLSVYAGKGSPQDIEIELKIIEKLEGKDFSRMQESEIRDIMKKRKLGVECSGFIARVLDGWTRAKHKKPIYSFIEFGGGILKKIFSRMRPYTHINVSTFVDKKNSREIKNLSEIMPGDIIWFDNSTDHAAIITGTEKDKNGNILKIYYAHSILEDENGGIKKGVIEFSSKKNDLSSQIWREEPETGHTINERGEPGIYRLNFIKL